MVPATSSAFAVTITASSARDIGIMVSTPQVEMGAELTDQDQERIAQAPGVERVRAACSVP